jgi:hypothetical protein
MQTTRIRSAMTRPTLHLTNGDYAEEATVIELAAFIVA